MISYIFYDGQAGSTESDEYAEITNQDGSPVNLGGWHLNAGDPGQDFGFRRLSWLLGRVVGCMRIMCIRRCVGLASITDGRFGQIVGSVGTCMIRMGVKCRGIVIYIGAIW